MKAGEILDESQSTESPAWWRKETTMVFDWNDTMEVGLLKINRALVSVLYYRGYRHEGESPTGHYVFHRAIIFPETAGTDLTAAWKLLRVINQRYSGVERDGLGTLHQVVSSRVSTETKRGKSNVDNKITDDDNEGRRTDHQKRKVRNHQCVKYSLTVRLMLSIDSHDAVSRFVPRIISMAENGCAAFIFPPTITKTRRLNSFQRVLDASSFFTVLWYYFLGIGIGFQIVLGPLSLEGRTSSKTTDSFWPGQAISYQSSQVEC